MIYVYIVIKEKTNNIFKVKMFRLLPLSFPLSFPIYHPLIPFPPKVSSSSH